MRSNRLADGFTCVNTRRSRPVFVAITSIALAASAYLPRGIAADGAPALTAAPIKDGRLVSSFGPKTDQRTMVRNDHGGIDIAAPAGTPVHAFSAGEVIESGKRKGCNTFVRLQHANQMRTLYCNLANVRVELGESVAHDHTLGAVAVPSTGSQAHLHFELEIAGKKVDPTQYLPTNAMPAG